MTLLQSRIQNPESTLRRGFSFVEVLFAVMILGIGFIMVAGNFPVAISQTQTNGEETIGAAVARGGVEYLARLPYDQITQSNPAGTPAMAADGLVHPIAPTGGSGKDAYLWHAVKGNLILPEDPRNAWVPLYRRTPGGNGLPETYAQVIVIAVRARNRGVYTEADVTSNPPGNTPTLAAKPVKVKFNSDPSPDVPDTVTFDSDGEAVAPGTYVVIARDTGASGTNNATGWVVRVGNQVSGNQWELIPGNDFKTSPYKPTGGDGFIVGQGLRDPTQAFNQSTNPYEGGTQDVAVYTSYIQLK